jgi:hypothetical protein
MISRRRLFASAVLVWGVLNAASLAAAASWVPTSTRDPHDRNPGDGVCASDIDGYCTLRAAIDEADMNPGADLITVPSGTYKLDRYLGALVLATDIEIRGGGAGATRIIGNKPYLGAPSSVAVRVNSGSNAKLTALAVRRSGTSSGCGGAIYVDAGGSLEIEDADVSRNTTLNDNGAAICNAGTLSLSNVTVSNNRARGAGGGLYNLGTATISDTTWRRNRGEVGGAIYNSGGTLSLANSTLTRNSATDGAAVLINLGSADLTYTSFSQTTAATRGGGLYNQGATTVLMTNTTVHHNKAYFGAGIAGSGTTIVNTILSDGMSPADPQAHNNCESASSVASLGHNLDSGNTCGLAGSGDLTLVEPWLGKLQYNGGATLLKVHALLAGSPALNSGDDTYCPATDERGMTRPVGICDIGAYEAQ